ncbi:hypothetical protein [Leptolyngbya sp. 7M]|uniref:hypothetical protein n=1 Tax=Leptolyngbya sp. 7M TaxID=2812896 RepID=UPI001B8C2C16|nr:hypothetical protein [Leptolyngbya sp. 7M]QYO68150.1 hypothetical protein JVX88_16120 [Leptolyngbya sp. 7M]
MLSLPSDTPHHASLIFESIVPKEQATAFQSWHSRLRQTARQFRGYIRTDLCPPVNAHQLKWYSIMHFESPEHLQDWLESDTREALLLEGQQFFETYQFKSFETGLEGWFSRQKNSDQVGLGAPAWKQNLAVILGLYPTVMVQTLLFAKLGIMQDWSLASAMLINNVISSSILTWTVMPFVTKTIQFWLQPAHQPTSSRSDLMVTGAITLSLIVMMMVFNQIQ